MVQARISEMFAPEANAGIRVFSGGKDLIDIADMAAEERDAVLYCFDLNVKKIENISPKIAASLRPQREAMVKFAQIAKGTFPETKTYSYPGQSGGLGVDFLSPYTFSYNSSATKPDAADGSNGFTEYLDSTVTGFGSWNLNFAAANNYPVPLLGGWSTKGTPAATITYYYKAAGETNKHSYVVLFQDGIIELGTTPRIQQLFFKTQLMDKYTPIAQNPMLNQSLEEGRSIYQYTTPGMIPVSHQTGVQIVAQGTSEAGTSYIPLLGMVFYETDFNAEAMSARTNTSVSP